MRTRPLKLLLFVLTAGGVAAVVKQRVRDANPTPERAAEPFMRPSQPAATPAAAVRPPDGSTSDDESVEPVESSADPDSDPQPEPEPEVADREAVDADVAEPEASSGDSSAPDGDSESGDPAPVAPFTSATVELDLDQIAAEREAATPVEPSAAKAETAPSSGSTSPDLTPLPQPPHGPFTVAPDGPADNLGRISGVGPKLQRLLNEQGITQLSQIAALTDAEIDVLQSRIMQFPGRIRRDRWVEQARRLTAEG